MNDLSVGMIIGFSRGLKQTFHCFDLKIGHNTRRFRQ